MNHESYCRQDPPPGSSDRAFGGVFSGFFLLLAILSYFSRLPFGLRGEPAWFERCPWFAAHPGWSAHGLDLIFLAASLIFLLFALLVPKALAPFNRLWTRFGLLLHQIVSPVVLGLMFFLIVTPMGVIMRLRGGDPLRLRFDADARSYWIERSPPGPAPESLKDQF